MIDQIHHLASAADWEQRTSEHYEPAGLAIEGFIHLCTAGQLDGVIERYYQGRTDLVMLTVSVDSIDAELVWEDSVGVGEAFPHVYGPLNLSAVVSAEIYESRS